MKDKEYLTAYLGHPEDEEENEDEEDVLTSAKEKILEMLKQDIKEAEGKELDTHEKILLRMISLIKIHKKGTMCDIMFTRR